jgi:hypothetical protein
MKVARVSCGTTWSVGGTEPKANGARTVNDTGNSAHGNSYLVVPSTSVIDFVDERAEGPNSGRVGTHAGENWYTGFNGVAIGLTLWTRLVITRAV